MQIKRSMSVHPSPIVREKNGNIRFPRQGERKLATFGGGVTISGHYEEWEGEWGYRITRVTNSVDYRPGFALSRDNVKKLIDDGWTVTVLSS